ncbi:MAG: hypothetical protein JKY22_06645, partial [Flavobacteriaceae bacterium]|nr:hypothetical protein [Flavobacteriaceae bacterium]
MKPIVIALVLLFNSIGYAQYNTSPTDTDPPQILSDGTYYATYPTHLFVENRHFIGQGIPSTTFTDGFLTVYDENLSLETAVEIPNYNGPPSQSSHSAVLDERMGYQNGNLYFF